MAECAFVKEFGAIERRQVELSDLCNERIEPIRPADVDAPLAPNVSVGTRRDQDRDHWSILAIAVIALKIASVRGDLVEIRL